MLRSDDKEALIRSLEPAEEYVLVDGYNIIHAWDELREIARDNLDAARHVLMDRLCNYQGYRNCALILVFDAYRVPQGLGRGGKYPQHPHLSIPRRRRLPTPVHRARDLCPRKTTARARGDL